MSDQTDVLQGTLDLLIMRTLALEPAKNLPRSAHSRAPWLVTSISGRAPRGMHGWAIAQRINQISDELLRVQQGSLYPALHRLEHQGWITAEWGASENNRRARFYSLTKAGRKQLSVEMHQWDNILLAIQKVLQAKS
jgi:transcriptional regulator